MTHHFRTAGRRPPFACLWHRGLGPSLVALALALPGTGDAHSLEQLLRLPLERLLQMQTSPAKPLRAAPPGARVAAAPALKRGHDAV